MVGAVAALASNLFFGQGPWTPWQMVGWGGVGLFGAGLARVARPDLGRVPLAAACAARRPRVRRGDEPLALGHLLGRPHAAKLGAGVRDLAAVRHRPRARQRRLLPRLRPGARARAAPLPDPLRDHLAPAARRPPAWPWRWPRCSSRCRCGRRRPRRRKRRCATWSARRTADGGIGPAPGARSTQVHTRLGRARARRGGARSRARVSAAAASWSTTSARTRASSGATRGERSRTILALRAAGAAPARSAAATSSPNCCGARSATARSPAG